MYPETESQIHNRFIELDEFHRNGSTITGGNTRDGARRPTEMLKLTELSMSILRLQTEKHGQAIEGLTFIRIILVPIQETIVLDRLVVSEEGVRQLAVKA
jgi:hypothetical protein